jgi:hypothetical protein
VKEIVAAESDVETQIPRDQWERPMILPRTGHKPDCAPVLDSRRRPKGYCTCAKAHTRMSTLSSALDSGHGLFKWQQRELLKGAGRKPHLAAQATVASYQELAGLVDEAMDASDAGVAAARGSYMHRLTEMLDNRLDLPSDLPSNVEAMLDAYTKEFVEVFETLDTEEFVVCDRLGAAGTYDKRLRHRETGKVLIGDTKTGSDLDRMILKTTIQITGYANGDLYSLDGERTPHGASRLWGALIWLPWTDDPDKAECEVRYLDLTMGREYALLAKKVHAANTIKAGQISRHNFPWTSPGVGD